MYILDKRGPYDVDGFCGKQHRIEMRSLICFNLWNIFLNSHSKYYKQIVTNKYSADSKSVLNHKFEQNIFYMLNNAYVPSIKSFSEI